MTEQFDISTAAKELFAACRREILTAAADECAKFGLQSLCAAFDSCTDYCWHWSEAVAVFQHAPQIVLYAGGDKKLIPQFRASVKLLRELELKWQELQKREADAKRTVDESLQERLARGMPVLGGAAVETNGVDIPF